MPYFPDDAVHGQRFPTALGVTTGVTLPIAESDVTGLVDALAGIATSFTTVEGEIAALTGGESGYYEPVTNGDSDSPEIVFSDGDVVMVFHST